jgi:tetratricopeptide (TPR) repeat protein
MALRLHKLALIGASALMVCFPSSAYAQGSDVSVDADEPVSVQSRSGAELTILFEKLVSARTPDDARTIEEAIWDRWNRSGSISVDLLLDRGLEALAEGDYDRALGFLDEVVDLAPGFPEGWNKRATVYFLLDDYASALGDIEATLALEPRHFGAIGGLALILEELGDKEGALDAYRRVLGVYPWLEGAKESESRLTVEIEGRGI